jgi:hypothetical protein
MSNKFGGVGLLCASAGTKFKSGRTERKVKINARSNAGQAGVCDEPKPKRFRLHAASTDDLKEMISTTQKTALRTGPSSLSGVSISENKYA